MAIEGIITMSADLDEAYYSLLNNKVPKLWEKSSYLSLKPLGSWIIDLAERVAFFADWLTTGGPCSFWISGFFFP